MQIPTRTFVLNNFICSSSAHPYYIRPTNTHVPILSHVLVYYSKEKHTSALRTRVYTYDEKRKTFII